MKNLITGSLICALAQLIVWFQTNLQFMWPATKPYRLPIAIFCGSIISYLFMLGVADLAQYFEGKLWPSRLIPQAIGTIIFSIMTWFIMKQGIDTKTLICLILAFSILGIQLFWK